MARNLGRYVDQAAGFAIGWNFWVSEVALVIFEISAFTIVIGFWESATRINSAVFITIVLAAYAILNFWDSRFYGHAEFSFAAGKVILIMGLLCFTFISMLGGNPLHDRFGFRYWKNPGAFTTPYPDHGTANFEGWLVCVINAAFSFGGPEYLSVVAGEARNPRKTMTRAFKATIYRLVIFFIGSALAVGILVPYNDQSLIGAIAAGLPGAARSPYVIAMRAMSISVLPHIVNALILSSVFSAGNAYLFCGSRSLAQMARDGQAPKILGKRNRNGVPYLAVLVCYCLALLAYCQVSTSSTVVISYLSNLVGSAQLMNWVAMSFTWIRWNNAYKEQGISRDVLPVRSWGQPYVAWYALLNSIFVLFMQGYTVFLKNSWDTATFFFAYAMPIVFVVLFTGWKLVKKTTWETGATADITSFVNDPEFTEYIDYNVIEKRGKYGQIVHKVLSTLF
ncbi:hypothetical protein MNV49_001757 [Pseudohyphozyma bogoriensis]|nr:hypothetical protein MNV49_001757 [Pseudohyphozyma bogoriensis]